MIHELRDGDRITVDGRGESLRSVSVSVRLCVCEREREREGRGRKGGGHKGLVCVVEGDRLLLPPLGFHRMSPEKSEEEEERGNGNHSNL
jgi:hypothetical protein